MIRHLRFWLHLSWLTGWRGVAVTISRREDSQLAALNHANHCTLLWLAHTLSTLFKSHNWHVDRDCGGTHSLGRQSWCVCLPEARQPSRSLLMYVLTSAWTLGSDQWGGSDSGHVTTSMWMGWMVAYTAQLWCHQKLVTWGVETNADQAGLCDCWDTQWRSLHCCLLGMLARNIVVGFNILHNWSYSGWKFEENLP